MNNFEAHIDVYLQSLKDSSLKDAMRYCLEGGKRFRPNIIFAIIKGFGIDEAIGYDAALGLEMIQTYSLIHDDLPAMDNDDYRRGKLSCHKKYGEDIAILTGDCLLTDAFNVIADSSLYDNDTKCKLIATLSKYAGYGGMVYGQLLDIEATNKILDEEMLKLIHINKTACLFRVATTFGAYISKCEDIEYFDKLGLLIGQLFQNQDDLFDIIKEEKELGKTASDLKNGKFTALSIYSKNELEALIDKQYQNLQDYLADAKFDTSYLNDILVKLKRR